MSKSSRLLEVIFCDDIREEVGNKFSYMGVYSGQLSVPNAPVLLSKLCVVARVTSDFEDPFQSLEVRIVSVKGEEETELLTTGPVVMPSELPKQEDGASRIVLSLTFVLTPFQISEPMLLRVKATTESEELRGSTALRIKIAAPTATPTPISATPTTVQ